MEQISFTASNIERIRRDIASGTLMPSPSKPAFRDADFPRWKLRTSSRNLTFVYQHYQRQGDETVARYATVNRLSVSGGPVTPEVFEPIRSDFLAMREAYEKGESGALIDKIEEEEKSASTLDEWSEEYFGLRAARACRSFPAIRRNITNLLDVAYIGGAKEQSARKFAGRRYGSLTLAQISTAAACNLFEAIESLPSRRQYRANFLSMFAALRKDGKALPERNPFKSVPAVTVRKKGEASPRQDRKFSPPELRAWAKAVDRLFSEGSITASERDFAYYIALTGRRRGRESWGLTWREVSLTREVITLPGARMKNAVDFEQPISAPLAAMLRRRKREFDALPDDSPAKTAGLVFWNRQGLRLANFPRLTQKIDRRLYPGAKARVVEGEGDREESDRARRIPEGVTPWLWHDWRRTVVFFMEEAFDEFFPEPHGSLMLGHRLISASEAKAAYMNPKLKTLKRTLFDYWAKTFATLLATTADEFPTPDQRNGAEESLQAHVRRDGENYLRSLCDKLA